MKQFEFELKSLIITVGATHSGKSYFCKNKLLPSLKFHDTANVQYLSSDETRIDLLGNHFDRMHDMMSTVSDPAFKLMECKVDLLMQFPVVADFIVVDATNLSQQGRDRFLKIAKKNNYRFYVLNFNYDDRDLFYSNITKNDFCDIRQVVNRHIKKLKEEQRNITKLKKDNATIYTLKNNKFDEIDISVRQSDIENHFKSNIPSIDTIVISDIHGCYNEFVELLEKSDFAIDKDTQLISSISKYPCQLVINGDFIDKGKDIIKTVNLLHANINNPIVKIVKGNHENYVYKYLKGLLKDYNDHFDSINLYQNASEEDRNKFFEVVESSFEFYKNNFVYITHAPCKNKYLGKYDASSLRNMRTFVYTTEDNKPVEEMLQFVKEESCISHPYHVFGHIANAKVKMINNKIFSDTGIVLGNRLTAIKFESGRKPSVKYVGNYTDVVPKECLDVFSVQEINLDEFDDAVVRQAKAILNNKINFVSGTISPCNKHESSLESLDAGIEYYKSRGVDKIIAQPKFMGSRFNAYLFEDESLSYGVSRNGYVVRQELNDSLREEYKRLWNRISPLYPNAKVIIADCELLPWSAMGTSLIDRHFFAYSAAISSEANILNEYGYNDAIEKIEKDRFNSDFFKLDKKDAIEALGHSKYTTFNSLQSFSPNFKNILEDYDDTMFNLKKFDDQVKLYGSTDIKLEIQPFMILKVVYNDDTEQLIYDNTVFKDINDSKYFIVDLNNEDNIDELKSFYSRVTTKEYMEGIVLKPLDASISLTQNIAHCIKCRNEEYLRIVYGHDYTNEDKYKKLLDRKGITKKLKTSIAEFRLGDEMLKIKYSEINKSDKKQVLTVCKLIGEIESEKQLDPRL